MEDAIITKDLNGTITSWNRGAEQIFGYTAEEAVGKSIFMLEPPDLPNDMAQIMNVVKRGGVVDHYETTRVGKDGNKVRVWLTVTPIRNTSGRVVGATKTVHAISQPEQIRLDLRDSEERFRATFEQAAVGIAHVGLEGSFLRVNRRLCDILGYSRDELLKLDFAAVTFPEDLAADWKNVHALLAGKIDTYRMEKRYIRKNGTLLWANLTVSLVRGGANEAKYFISVIADITARKAAEQAMQRQADLLDQAQEPIFAWQPGGTIIYWNRAAAELYGYSREEAVGRKSHDLLKTGLPSQAAEFERMLEAKRLWQGELTHTTKDGREIIVESHQKVIYENGRPLVLESNRDVTERKRVERQLAEMYANLEMRVEERTNQLRQANQELEAFAYSVSHDLRAPLRSIDGFGQILLREYSGKVLDETGELYIQKMSAAADRMGHLIHDLLELSRVSRTELLRQKVDMSEMARSGLAELQAQSPDRQVAVEIEKGMTVRADPRLLRIALNNLLGNAWKFSQKQPQARIEFKSREAAGDRVYYVRDNGAGFSMKHARNLFGAFQRLHSQSEFEGTGIGLAIVQRVIHRHGGTITAEGEPGRGATFYFTLG